MDSLLFFLEEDAQQDTPKRTFVDVVLPVPLPRLYTYSVPFHFVKEVQVGIRVEVQFGKNRLYSGVVRRIHNNVPEGNRSPKPIIAILDETPVVTEKQFKLWEWLADYYVATMGEVMNAAMPAGLKLSSETKIILGPAFDEEHSLRDPYLNNKDTFVLETLQQTNELSIDVLPKILKQKTVYPIVKKLLEKDLICIREELKTKYKPKQVVMIQLAEPYLSDSTKLKDAFQLISSRAQRQMEALMAVIQISKTKTEITRKEVCDKAKVDTSVIKKLSEKGIIDIYSVEVSRLTGYDKEGIGNYKLSDTQQKALDEIHTCFEEKNAVLLHGVTGSGKTQVFVELMSEIIATGRQVLYLLPEIALTAQIVGRLQKHFGDKVVVYHSKFNNNERVEIWRSALEGTPIIIGARSSLFLPFKDLGLIIVDEEHDPSYKQTDPAPRYNARDTAVFLTYLYGAKTLLGTATPSLETYRNVKEKKYGLVEMTQRFGGLALPEINIVNAAQSKSKGLNKNTIFTPELLQALQRTLDNGEQAILFQNRRGYAPVYRCNTCGWTSDCIHCDVSMTYHKFSNNLHCHYCGYKHKLPKACKACGSVGLIVQGFGTEKIEDELKIYLPDVRVVRMDWDTVKGRSGHNRIIKLFENKEVDVLVGTQMVTKGLDFDNVGLVGVLSADQMLNFPDFRATERAYQLITQVAGRAGRKKKQGKVYIQAYNIKHPILKEVKENNFRDFLNREMRERFDFLYPPFHRLIKIQLKHKKNDVVTRAAKFFAEGLRQKLGDRVLGPAPPGIARVRNYYMMDIMLKLGLGSKGLKQVKELVLELQKQLKSTKGYTTVRVLIDVDPY